MHTHMHPSVRGLWWGSPRIGVVAVLVSFLDLRAALGKHKKWNINGFSLQEVWSSFNVRLLKEGGSFWFWHSSGLSCCHPIAQNEPGNTVVNLVFIAGLPCSKLPLPFLMWEVEQSGMTMSAWQKLTGQTDGVVAITSWLVPNCCWLSLPTIVGWLRVSFTFCDNC